MRLIEPVQIRMIHVAVGQLGLSDDIYRDILHGHFKVASSKDLTYAQASALIDHFKKLGFKIVGRDRRSRRNPARRNPARNVTFLPSSMQLDMIDTLATQVAWKYADGFTRWLAKYIKTDKIRTSAQAQRAIEGLKGMLKNQHTNNSREDII